LYCAGYRITTFFIKPDDPLGAMGGNQPSTLDLHRPIME
jgi:hypothetical protein